jgi:hypothetical protein
VIAASGFNGFFSMYGLGLAVLLVIALTAVQTEIQTGEPGQAEA